MVRQLVRFWKEVVLSYFKGMWKYTKFSASIAGFREENRAKCNSYKIQGAKHNAMTGSI